MSQILISGFGGQGILFAGRFLAHVGLMQDREVSWLPSYGPEMRGGTANCSVILSDGSIGSPIVTKPDILIAMNRPSLDKFEDEVVAGAKLFVDSTLVDRPVSRDDVDTHYIPATRLARDNSLEGLANMIILGKMIKETGVIPYDLIPAAMEAVVSSKRIELVKLNMQALDMGYNY